jgi:hypothetical protein
MTIEYARRQLRRLAVQNVIENASSNQPQRWCMRQGAEKWRPLGCGDNGGGNKARETDAIHDGSPLTEAVVKTRV